MNLMKMLPAVAMGILMFTACSSDDDADADTVQTGDEPIIESLFKNDAEGWKIVGDAQGGYEEASFSPDGGVIDGYIYADDDVTGGVWFFAAPAAYKGNKDIYYNATLSFSLFQDSSLSNQFKNSDIIFKNGDKQITYTYGEDNYPRTEWTSYIVNISAGNGWLKGDYNSTEVATEADIKEVLNNVTDFWIRGEFESGPDTGGLDKVIIDK